MAEGIVVASPGALPGSTIEGDMQIEWKGLRMGPDTWMGYKNLTGWEDMPGIDSSFVPFPQAHGTWPGPMYANEKIVTFDSQIYAPSVEEFMALKRELDLRSNIDQEESPLVIQQHGQVLLAMARLTGRKLPINKDYFQYHPRATLQWTLSDPFRYGLESHSLLLAPPEYVGGLPWGAGLNWDTGLDWGTAISSGTGVLVNEGTTDARPKFTFVGPLTAPISLVSDAGWRVTLTDSIQEGQATFADVRTGEYLVNEFPALYALDSSANILEEAILKPGSNSITLLTGDVGTTTGYVIIDWLDTYN